MGRLNIRGRGLGWLRLSRSIAGSDYDRAALGGSRQLSRQITPVAHIVTLAIPIINYLLDLPDPPSRD